MARYDMIQFFKQITGKLGSNIYAGFQGQSNPQTIAFIRELQKEMKKNSSLDSPLNQLKVVVFDIETTGFHPEQGDQVISIGAVKMTGQQVHAEQTFYSLIRTDSPLPEEISLLTNIQQDELLTAPPPQAVLRSFFEFIQSDFLVAHHSRHEQAFMQKMTWDLMRIRFEHRIIDTSFLIRLNQKVDKPLPLEDVCRRCEIEIKDRHNALGDAIMTAQIWSYYLNIASQQGFLCLRDLYEYIAKGR